MEPQQKIDRHTANQAILTGRHEGAYYQNGMPRGGGRNSFEEIVVLYEATGDTDDGILNTLGLTDNRTPYDELAPMVEPKRVKRIVYFDDKGRRIGRDTLEL